MKNILFWKGLLARGTISKFNRHTSKIIFFLFILLLNLPLSPILSLDYFPTDEWRVSIPEEQGLDSTLLNNIYQKNIEEELGIDSIIIVKNGYMVYEEYFDYYNYSNLHNTWSMTKSIISLLIGIANTTGIISNLDQPILDIFTNRTFANVDARKQALSIRHLLKMQMGVQFTGVSFASIIDKHDYNLHSNLTVERMENLPVDSNNDFMRMLNSDDWVQYVLDKPMIREPGTAFNYNSGASHLLSAIIRIKTGMNTVDFAKKQLFDPLNITDYYWWNDSMGITTGYGGLWLQPIDLAKIGYLCLNNGTWNGNQVVPAEWIQESTTPYSIANVREGYGYQWWIHTVFDFYYAEGRGKQLLVIKPDENMVVVMTASDFHSDLPQMLVYSHILGSILPKTTTDRPTTTVEPTTSLTSSSNNTSFHVFFFGILSLILLTIHYRKIKQ